ncbi:hypothetical protein HPB50_027017 [Hyalomma asiaticum]|uniref:Uncharacterized protein n=1 Tax=Hyalomma asiaticum TaxID=266040 RepID=A0ACB7SJ06_HYAAI|nr:hypothetical protein HPB50_027017 [Hyalomma asiaticum]
MNHNSTKGELDNIDSDQSANELLKSVAFNESSPQSEASNSPNDTSVSKLPEIATSNETTNRSKSSQELASKKAAQQGVTDDITEIKEEPRASQFPEIAMHAESGLQSTHEKLAHEETAKESTSADAFTFGEETSSELPDVRVFSEANVKDKATEDSTSEERVNHSTINAEIHKVDAETPENESTGIVACSEMIALSNAAENLATERTVLEGVSDGDNATVDGQSSSNIPPEIAAPGEANVEVEISAERQKDVVEHGNPNNTEIAESKVETITSELSDTLPPNEDSVPDITSQTSTIRENSHETRGDTEVPKIMVDVPTSDLPEYPVCSEPDVGSKSTEELKSDAAVNEGVTDNNVADVKGDISIGEMSDATSLNEQSMNEAAEEATTSKGNAHQSSTDNGNAETKLEMSVSGLTEVTESDKMRMQAVEEIASQHPVTQNANDNYATDVTPGTSMSEPLENSELIKCPEREKLGNTFSETSEAYLESMTKDGASESVVVDVVTEQEQPKVVCVERAGSQTKLAKKFANADSYDEFTEDNETGSTSADSGDGELGTTRSVESREDGRVEMVDRAPEDEDIVRSSLQDTTKGFTEINASGDTHALNEERRHSQEESVHENTQERFAKQESVDDYAVDANNTTRDRSTSDGSTLEEVSAGFSETAEDHQTAVLEEGCEGVSNTAFEETADDTSGPTSKEGNAHTSEPPKRPGDGTDGGDSSWGQLATEELANATDGSQDSVGLAAGRSEPETGELLDAEISKCQDIVDATGPVIAEAYNIDALGALLNPPLQQETKDDRSSLLEYAEEIVSTVLTRCVTYLEENNQEWRREKQAGRNLCELNADTNSADKEDAIKTTRDDDEKLGVPLPHSDCTNKGSYNGDAFGPIVPRQSALEEVASFSDHQNAVTSRDSTQAVLVGPVSIGKEEDPNEMLSSPIPNEKQDESVNTGQAGERTANSETAENAETNAPVNNAENVVISQITEEQRDGDSVDNTASISEVSTEDASSSKVDTNSSLSASKGDHEFPGQTVVQSDQSEDKRHEEQSVVARQLDAASRDISEGVSETRQNFVVVENDSQRVESAHTVVAEQVIIGQEGQLHEKSFTESLCSAGEGGSEHSASDKDARRADDRENRDAENETAVNSFSESSATTVSINTENSEESVSEHSTRVSKQESDAVQATEVTKDNPGDSADEVRENIPNSEYKETRSPNAHHTVVDSNDDTEGHEKSAFWPRTFRKSSRQSDIPHTALHGHQGRQISEEANTTVVPDSHDMSGQDMHPEALVSDEENNQTNAFCTNVDYASQDKDISKPEGSAAVDNDMNSLGALSTVYESSLEYIRSYTDEHISASDVTATLIGDFSAVGKTTTSPVFPFKDGTALGGVFQTDEHSDEEKAEQDFEESVETTSDIGAENKSTQDVLKTKSDPEVTPGFVSDGTSSADALSRGIATADEMPLGVYETKIRDETLQEGEQPLEQDEVATMDFSDEEERSLELEKVAHEQIVSVDVHEVPIVHESDGIANGETETDDVREEIILEKANSAETTTNVKGNECTTRTEEANLTQLDVGIPVRKVEVGTEEHGSNNSEDRVENADVEGPSEKLPQTIGALKTAVMVHDDTKLEAVECSEDHLQSVATEADFSSDIYEHIDDELAMDAGTEETNAVIAESSNENADSEVTEAEDNDKNRLPNASDAKEHCKTDKDNQEDSLKTDSSESFDISAAGEEDIDSGSRNVKENTTRKVTEAVEQSERTEGGIPGSGDPIKSTRNFPKDGEAYRIHSNRAEDAFFLAIHEVDQG